jgi:hypothetical protein
MDTKQTGLRTGRRAAALLLGLIIAATAALATVGFDSRIQILGYEPSSGRLYFRLDSPKGEPNLPHVLFIEPDKPGGEPVEHELWGEGKREEDLPEIYRTIQEFAATLEPLEAYDGNWTLETAIERHDTIQDPYFGQEIERFATRLRFSVGPYAGDTLVTAYIDRTIEVIGFYEMPGGSEAVVHFSFTGDMFEGGYLTDALLVLKRRNGAEE